MKDPGGHLSDPESRTCARAPPCPLNSTEVAAGAGGLLGWGGGPPGSPSLVCLLPLAWPQAR